MTSLSTHLPDDVELPEVASPTLEDGSYNFVDPIFDMDVDDDMNILVPNRRKPSVWEQVIVAGEWVRDQLSMVCLLRRRWNRVLCTKVTDPPTPSRSNVHQRGCCTFANARRALRSNTLY